MDNYSRLGWAMGYLYDCWCNPQLHWLLYILVMYIMSAFTMLASILVMSIMSAFTMLASILAMYIMSAFTMLASILVMYIMSAFTMLASYQGKSINHILQSHQHFIRYSAVPFNVICAILIWMTFCINCDVYFNLIAKVLKYNTMCSGYTGGIKTITPQYG